MFEKTASSTGGEAAVDMDSIKLLVRLRVTVAAAVVAPSLTRAAIDKRLCAHAGGRRKVDAVRWKTTLVGTTAEKAAVDVVLAIRYIEKRSIVAVIVLFAASSGVGVVHLSSAA